MSFLVEQKINNKIYIYEATSVWDKEKKQSKQKRIYLGRKDKKTGRLILRRKKENPSPSLSFGSVYLLKKISSSLKLTHTLSKVFPMDYQKYLDLEYLDLAFFKISQAEPYYLYLRDSKKKLEFFETVTLNRT